ncbi:hypothetical protein HYS91_05320 [Candidatus Daviesbacteria bacterium]|nr:hypothetical protein [Candidatus Daviesbacteria bacterium]
MFWKILFFLLIVIVSPPSLVFASHNNQLQTNIDIDIRNRSRVTESIKITISNPNVFEVTKVNPSKADFLQDVSLTGSNFGSTPGFVNFYNRNSSLVAGAVISNWTNSEAKFKVPAILGHSRYYLELQKSDGTRSNKIKFYVDDGQPKINLLESSNARVGELLTIRGEELGRRGKVIFSQNGVNVAEGAVRSWTSSRIRVYVPAGLNSGQEYGIQIITNDNRPTSLVFYILGF